jgi:hypothetical protein
MFLAFSDHMATVAGDGYLGCGSEGATVKTSPN